jgi:hypothetical protein
MNKIGIKLNAKRGVVLMFVFIILSISGFAQNEKKFNYFVSTSDYLKGNISEDSVQPKKVVFESEEMLKIPKLIDCKTRKKSVKAGFPWAIYIDSIVYFNFRYGQGILCPELYVKPNVVGRYCVVYANKDYAKQIINYSVNYYGGGLTGALIKESEKWGRNWENQEEKVKIFIVDTKKLELQHMNGYKNAAWKILDKNNINEILGTEFSKQEIDEISLQDIKEIIAKRNNERQ